MFKPKPRAMQMVNFSKDDHKLATARATKFAKRYRVNRSISKYLMMTSDYYEESQKVTKKEE